MGFIKMTQLQGSDMPQLQHDNNLIAAPLNSLPSDLLY
jgi:hypothetical protein